MLQVYEKGRGDPLVVCVALIYSMIILTYLLVSPSYPHLIIIILVQ